MYFYGGEFPVIFHDFRELVLEFIMLIYVRLLLLVYWSEGLKISDDQLILSQEGVTVLFSFTLFLY